MRRLVSLLAVLVVAVSALRADTTVARLLPGPLAGAERVRAALRERLQADPGSGLELVQQACDEGGPAAAHALIHLAGHADPGVREAALLGVGVLRLRHDGLRTVALEVWEQADGTPAAVRRAALRALGWCGDARDVPLLLEVAANEGPEAAAALTAFRTLTGLVSISGDAARRLAWWEGVCRNALLELELAVDGMEGEDGERDASIFRTLLRLRGIHDVPFVSERLREWLRSNDPHLRAEAARAAGSLRIAELAEDLVSLERFALSRELREAARQALGALGVPHAEPGPAPPR